METASQDAIVYILMLIASLIILVFAILSLYRTRNYNSYELDEYQCNSWRLDGYSEEQIKEMCKIFNITYVEHENEHQ